MEALLRHGGGRQVSQRTEGAVQQVLDLQDLREVGQQLDGDELSQVLSGNSKIDNGFLPAPGTMRSSGMPSACRAA
jgi:hypothetical protein